MADSLTSDLLDLCSDTLIAYPGSTDAFGGFAISGSALSLPARIVSKARLVRDLNGQEVVSSVKATVMSSPGLSVERHRYTIPSRYIPSSMLRAITVEKYPDENGAHHEVVFFP